MMRKQAKSYTVHRPSLFLAYCLANIFGDFMLKTLPNDKKRRAVSLLSFLYTISEESNVYQETSCGAFDGRQQVRVSHTAVDDPRPSALSHRSRSRSPVGRKRDTCRWTGRDHVTATVTYVSVHWRLREVSWSHDVIPPVINYQQRHPGITVTVYNQLKLQQLIMYNLKNKEAKFSWRRWRLFKGNQILGLIRRTFTYMDCELMKQLFTSLVRLHLEYGNVVWHPYLKKDIDILESVQHLSLIHIWRCRRSTLCRSRWSPYH